MSSTSPTFSPLSTGNPQKKKKKRPNFRPRAKNSTSVGTVAATVAEIPKLPKTNNETSPSGVPVVASANTSTKRMELKAEDYSEQTAQDTTTKVLDSEPLTRAADSPATEQTVENVATKGDSEGPKEMLKKAKTAPLAVERQKVGDPGAKPRKRKRKGVAIGASRPTFPIATTVVAAVEGASPLASAGAAMSASTAAPVTTPNEESLPNVPVGASKPVEPPPDEIPEDTSGAPKLGNFCSKFRTKRRKKRGTKQDQQPQQQQAQPQCPEGGPEEVEEATPTGPLVQIINGEIVLQESSMVVNGTTARPDDEFPVIEEEAQMAAVGASYNSFVNRRAPQHWTVEETALFYEALRQVGLDFGTMQVYFGKTRTRKQLKKKYQKESTKNPHLIEMALDPSSRTDIDLSVFQVTTEMIEAVKMPEMPQKVEQPIEAISTDIDPSSGAVNDEPINDATEAITDHIVDDGEQPEPVRDSFWPDEEETPEDSIMEDPMFETMEDPVESAPIVALLPGVASTKKKKPKFRSRKPKAK